METPSLIYYYDTVYTYFVILLDVLCRSFANAVDVGFLAPLYVCGSQFQHTWAEMFASLHHFMYAVRSFNKPGLKCLLPCTTLCICGSQFQHTWAEMFASLHHFMYAVRSFDTPGLKCLLPCTTLCMRFAVSTNLG